MRISYDTLTPLHQDVWPKRSTVNVLLFHMEVLFNSCTGVKCKVYSTKDLGFNGCPLLSMLSTTLVNFGFLSIALHVNYSQLLAPRFSNLRPILNNVQNFSKGRRHYKNMRTIRIQIYNYFNTRNHLGDSHTLKTYKNELTIWAKFST